MYKLRVLPKVRESKFRLIFGFLAGSLLIASCRKENQPSKHTPINIVSDAPVITTISPALGNANTLVTISGKNFNALATGDTVKFNGADAVIQSVTDTAITVLAPTAGTNGTVTVATVKGKATGPVFTYGADVFAIGTMAVPGYVMLYWKNGVQISLDGSEYGYPTGLAVVDTNVYIAGYYYDTGGDPQGLFWKNLSLSKLSEGLVKHTTGGLAVSGNDVYVAGFLEPDNVQNPVNIAEYWKNGQPVILSDTTQFAQATAIAVNGADVYVVGNVSGTRIGWQGAVVWKNGVETILPQAPGGQYDYATGITIVNGDVYISGYDNLGATTTAEYWKNGVRVSLSDNGVASCIMVIGNDVYVGGSTWNGYHSTATYWKNGQAVSLTDGTNDAAITGLSIDGSDVYASGYRQNNNAATTQGYAPVYWKNGVETRLTRFELVNGYLTGIVVKAHRPY